MAGPSADVSAAKNCDWGNYRCYVSGTSTNQTTAYNICNGSMSDAINAIHANGYVVTLVYSCAWNTNVPNFNYNGQVFFRKR